MDQQDQFQQLFQLQLLYLNQQITKQLQQRNLTEPGLSTLYINFCKESSSDQDFQNLIFTQNPNTIVSKHFLTSLYHTIKQKLPRKPNLHDDDINSYHQFKQQKIEHQYSTKKQQHLDNYQHKQNNPKLDKHSFPGLSLPNNDEIDLDLDLDQPIVQKIDQIKKLEKDIERSPIEQNQKYQSKKQKQRHRHPSQSHSYDRQRRKSYSQESRDRSRKKDKKHKEHKQKKDKKHKKDKHRNYSQNSRSPSHQKHHQKSKQKDNYKQGPLKHQYKRKDYPKIQPPLKQFKQGIILQGTIRKVDKLGCIVNLLNTEEPKIATLHAKQIKQNFEGDPQQIIKTQDKVWVKIIGVLEGRIRVSMKGINQFDGRDLNAKPEDKQQKSDKNTKKDIPEKTRGTITGIKITQQDELNDEGEGTTYGQMWELSRLGYMGKGPKVKHTTKEDIQEVNIECDDRQPPFLRGQTTKAGINLSPVRIVKNPQGTLQRQAESAVQYAKERRQIREKTKNQTRGEMTKVLDQVIPDHSLMKKGSKRTSLTIKQQRQSLPIFNYREQLIKACMDNRILIVIGQTGSGKTTQITQYLHEAGLTKRGKIGCTQPRRVAAMSVAKRVCEEMGVTLGEEVGYSIRFEDYTSSRTIIKYMTDGMLLREALLDKYLSQYSVIMLDEAHERTINTDVLFGILKNVAQKRKDFTLIVTSATLEAKKFSSYFFDCKIFSIPGRTYNVEILYAKQPETDYLDAALMCVLQIHIDEPPGDILLFLTGQQEIDTACQVLNQRMKKLGSQAPELIVLPVYSALPSQLQSKIFDPAPRGKRKCVIATNIAQASLTIDGIYYVVDPGFSKVKIYNSKLGMDTLVVAPISQASAKQRAGRAGRTGPGKCYRLYTEEAYQTQMLPTSIPEIQRANLSNTVLELKAMGINDLINFDFMDPPPVQTLIAALEQLYYLSALDDEGLLTKLGRKMAEFPLEPPLSKMLLTSIDFGCTEQIATIISLLSVQNIFYRPKQKEVQADQKKTKFLSSEGDHLTYLSIFDGWKKSGFSQNWCHQNYIQLRSLKRAMDVKKQIIDLLQRYRFKIQSCNGNTTLIRKTIVSGFFFHAAKKDSKGGYRTLVDDHQVYIHPSSSLFNKQPEWVIYHELIFTSKEYMRDVCAINPKWLIDVAPNFFKFTDELGFTRKKRNQKLDPLNQKYGDPNAWRLSKRRG